MSQAGSVLQDNTASLLITGSVLQDNTIGSLLTGSDGPFVFYCFIIDFNLYFFVESGFDLYTLRRQQVHQYKTLQMFWLQFKCYYPDLDPSK